MNAALIRPWVLWTVLVLCAGCTGGDSIHSAVLLNHSDCTIAKAGMQVVSYEDVALLRGSTLLSMTSAPINHQPDLILLAISNGRQPTPGYRFDLIGAFAAEGIATLELRWLAPADDSPQPQMITHPCIVIGLEHGAFESVRAVDEHDNPLGEVAI